MKLAEKGVVALCSIIFGTFAAALLDWRWHLFSLLGLFVYFYRPKFDGKQLKNVFRQTGLVKKIGDEEQSPAVISEREKDGVTTTILSLPVGLSSHDFQRKSQPIAEALNADVSFTYNNGQIIMKTSRNKLKILYNYESRTLGPVEIPIGHSLEGFETLKFSDEYSSMLIGGASGYGKTAFLRQMLVSLCDKQVICHLVDLKFGAEFGIFRRCRMVEDFASSEEEVFRLTSKLEKLVINRYRTFQEAGVVKIDNYNKKLGGMAYHLVAIDEFASLNSSPEILNKLIYLARISRAAGLFMIFATQYPTTEAIPSALKFNCQVRLAFKVKMAVNSRVILDRDGAEDLQCPGRAIFSTGRDVVVQVPFLDEDQAVAKVQHTYTERKRSQKVEEGAMPIEAYRARQKNH